jgi:hypothetical protein
MNNHNVEACKKKKEETIVIAIEGSIIKSKTI